MEGRDEPCRHDTKEMSPSSKARTLSECYLDDVKRRSRYPKILLLSFAALAAGTSLIMKDLRYLGPAGMSVTFFLLMVLREAVLTVRVRRGFFGSVESEVRDLIRFIVENADNSDFTDEGGRRRPIWVREPQTARSNGSIGIRGGKMPAH